MLLLYADNDQATVAVRRLQQQTGQRVMVQNPKYFDGSIPNGFLGESGSATEPMAGHYYVPGCRHEAEIRYAFRHAGVPLQALGTGSVPEPVPPPMPLDDDVVPTAPPIVEAAPPEPKPKPKPKPKQRRKARKKRTKKRAAKQDAQE